MREAQTPDPPRSSVGGLRALVKAFFAKGPGALVAFITGVVALLFTLFPGIKPFSPTTLGAAVKVVGVERAISRDDWRRRVAVGDRERYRQLVLADNAAKKTKPGDPCAEGTLLGVLLYVKTHAEGYKRKQLTLRAVLYDASTGARLELADQYDPLARVPIDVPTKDSVQLLWLWSPSRPEQRGEMFARVEIYDPNEQLLDVANSGRFKALSEGESERLDERLNARLPGCP
jgi:hypothetical protein